MTTKGLSSAEQTEWGNRAEQFRIMMDRETRSNPVVLLGAIIIFILIALLPVGVLIVSTQFEFEAFTEPSPSNIDRASINSAAADAAGTLALQVENLGLTELMARLERIEKLEEDQRNAEAQGPIFNHSIYRAQVLFLAGSVVLTLALFAVALAQIRLVVRLWEPVFRIEKDKETYVSPTVQFAIAFGISICAAFALHWLIDEVTAQPVRAISPWSPEGAKLSALVGLIVLFLALGFPFHDRSNRPLNEYSEAILRNAPGIIAGLSFYAAYQLSGEVIDELRFAGKLDKIFHTQMADPTLRHATIIVLSSLAAITTLSLFGAWTTARNFPGAVAVSRTKRRILGTDDVETTWKGMVEFFKKDTEINAPALRLQSTAASDSVALVRMITTVLAVLFVIVIITISLGLDLLELRTSFSGDLLKAAQNSNDAWLSLIGAIFTVQLAVVYLWPIVHLSPFAEAEAALKKTAKAAPSEDVDASAKKAAAGKEPAFEMLIRLTPPDETKNSSDDDAERTKTKDATRRLTRYLGANEDKFAAVLNGSRYGGNFHELFTQDRITLILKILTVLSPSIVGAVLQAIK